MTKEQTDSLIKKFSSAIRPVDVRPLWEWLHDRMPLPSVYNPSGAFQIDFYPYLKRPMADLTNDLVKQVNLASCTQAGKSLLQQVYLPFIILECPGPVSLVCDTDANAKKVMEERVIPLLNNNKDIKRLLDSKRFSARKSGVLLPHMNFRAGGPAESNVLGYSARYILGDEIWRWQADFHNNIIDKLKGRTTAYNATRKILLASQPDYEGSDWHKECMRGLWWEYGYKCPACTTLQLYEWNGESNGQYFGMVFDSTDEEKNYDKKASSARLVCQHCFHEIKDTPSNRKSLVMNGDYILVHSGPDTSIHTYSWNQFCNISIPFKQISLSYFDAVIQKRTLGLRTKHELFRQQTLGRFWKKGQQVDSAKMFVDAYASSADWPEETIRFLTIDPQKDYLNWLVRAWSNKVAESRLIDWGTCGGFDEIEEIIKKYKIDPLCVGIDSGNDTRAVYKESCIHSKAKQLASGKSIIAQWTCLRGDGGSSPLSPKKFYKHKVTENGKTFEIDRLYSPMQYVDCQWAADSKFRILRAHLYNWSNLSIKIILQKLRQKELPFNWKVNERANADYQAQMHSEELSMKTGRFEQIHPKNHIWDMECMQLVMSLLASTFIPSASEMNDIAAVKDGNN